MTCPLVAQVELVDPLAGIEGVGRDRPDQEGGVGSALMSTGPSLMAAVAMDAGSPEVELTVGPGGASRRPWP
jgi:hypothetical protein